MIPVLAEDKAERHRRSTAGWEWQAARSWGLQGGLDRQGLGAAWVGRQAWCSRPEAGPQAQLSSLKPQFFFSREKQMAPLILWHFQASLRYYMQDPSANCSTTPKRHTLLPLGRGVHGDQLLPHSGQLKALSKSPCSAIRQGKKRNKQLPDWKEEVKLFPFSDDIILCKGHTKEPTKNKLN